jgi:hypothetical protein
MVLGPFANNQILRFFSLCVQRHFFAFCYIWGLCLLKLQTRYVDTVQDKFDKMTIEGADYADDYEYQPETQNKRNTPPAKNPEDRMYRGRGRALASGNLPTFAPGNPDLRGRGIAALTQPAKTQNQPTKSAKPRRGRPKKSPNVNASKTTRVTRQRSLQDQSYDEDDSDFLDIHDSSQDSFSSRSSQKRVSDSPAGTPSKKMNAGTPSPIAPFGSLRRILSQGSGPRKELNFNSILNYPSITFLIFFY